MTSDDVSALRDDVAAMRRELHELKVRRSMVEGHLEELKELTAELAEAHDRAQRMAEEAKAHLDGDHD